MRKSQKQRNNKSRAVTPVKAHVVLTGEARELYRKSRERSERKHQLLTESIRASQCLSKEDFDIRINTRD